MDMPTTDTEQANMTTFLTPPIRVTSPAAASVMAIFGMSAFWKKAAVVKTGLDSVVATGQNFRRERRGAVGQALVDILARCPKVEDAEKEELLPADREQEKGNAA
jgi:hypothetical protein